MYVLRAPVAGAVLAALALLAPVGGRADAPAIPTAAPNPASITTVGGLRVERYGSGTPAMIFIPGLSCGSWVWDGAVTAYAKAHAVYVVTLPGFDGLPASASPSLDAADAALLQMITNEKLARPILVGHSMGGFLALRFGTEHPTLVRGVVTIDGLPVFPTLARATPDDRIAAAKAFSGQIADETQAQYAAGQTQTIATMVTDPANVAHVAKLTGTSDPKAVATYADQLLAADLRPQLPNLNVPTLVLAPVPTTPASYEPPNLSMADRAAGYKAFYTSLFSGAPHLTVVTIPNSKHFTMVDQPAATYAAITTFVATL